jgi:hypothetical protein
MAGFSAGSLVAPLVGSAVMAVMAFVVAYVGRFMPYALLYHVIIFAFFWGIYQALPGGFKKNFNTPTIVSDKSWKGDGPSDVAYYTMVMHTSTGFGDVFPITWIARVLVMIHLALVFMSVANLLPVALKSASTLGMGMGGMGMGM